MQNANGDEFLEVHMAQSIGPAFKWGILCAFPILTYFAPIVPLSLYGLGALGGVAWYLFVSSYNMASRLFNEATLLKVLADIEDGLDKGTLSDNDGLSKDESNDEEG